MGNSRKIIHLSLPPNAHRNFWHASPEVNTINPLRNTNSLPKLIETLNARLIFFVFNYQYKHDEFQFLGTIFRIVRYRNLLKRSIASLREQWERQGEWNFSLSMEQRPSDCETKGNVVKNLYGIALLPPTAKWRERDRFDEWDTPVSFTSKQGWKPTTTGSRDIVSCYPSLYAAAHHFASERFLNHEVQ